LHSLQGHRWHPSQVRSFPSSELQKKNSNNIGVVPLSVFSSCVILSL
jgi:hypothetical protein